MNSCYFDTHVEKLAGQYYSAVLLVRNVSACSIQLCLRAPREKKRKETKRRGNNVANVRCPKAVARNMTMLAFFLAVGIFKVLPLKHSRLLMFDFVCRPSFLILESNVVHYKKVYESM